jgi:ABC-2 type transport system permease protein
MHSSSLNNIWLVARREYLERVRAKSFLIMTILIPTLMGGAIGAVAFMGRNMGSGQHIAVITDNPKFASDIQTEMADSHGLNKPIIDVYTHADPSVPETLNRQLKTKGATLDGYLVVTAAGTAGQRPTFQWVPKVQADVITRGRVADAVRGALIREKLAGSGMTTAEVDSLLAPVDLAASNGKSDHAGAAVASAYGMYFLMYFIILFYGMNVARSIIEEKTSRIFEVLLATVKPTEMLAGKVIGVGAVGLTQVVIWITLAIAVVESQLIGSDIHILPSAGQGALFVIFFLLGYLLYSSIAAALGAMTNSEQELQQMQIFLMLPLIFSSLIIFQVITNPDGVVAKWASFVPFTAPLIMYTRVIVGKPGEIAVAGSILGLVLTVSVVLWFASRIYRVGILMYGKKPNLPEILRWLKYS